MRIVQVSPYLYPHLGGVENHVEELSRHLAMDGHDVTVITSMHKKGLPEREEHNGYTIIRVPVHSILFNTPIMPSVGKVVSSIDADVYHIHFPPPITEFFAIRGLRKKKAPTVLTYHCDLDLPIPGGRYIVELYSKIITLYSVSKVDEVIMTSVSYAATSRGMWSTPVVVIPNAVDPDRYNPSVDGSAIKKELGLQGKDIVMYVGRLRFHKGLEYFIESAQFTDENIIHVIVGEGEHREKLEELVSMLGLEKKVVFAGRAPYDRLPEYYAAADICVLPSVSRLEAFGIVGLEAMASGKPVLVSDIPGVRSVIENGVQGLLVHPFDPNDLGLKINNLMSDPDLRREMGERGRMHVLENYSWPVVVRRIVKVYEEVISR